MSAEMNRRDMLQRVAWLMGGAISAPAVLGVLNGCSATKVEAAWQPTFLSKRQGALVSEVAEVIIPKTDTPGAKEAGVPAFIDVMLKDVYEDEGRQRYVSGLKAFDDAARTAHGKAFVELPKLQQAKLVRKFHDEAVVAELALDTETSFLRRPFILMTKELTLLGFFTSNVGATEVLQYAAVPGAFRGCVPLTQAGNGKSWALPEIL
jgi:gluconate 2-dehydrogenase gamma chain